MIYWSNLYDIVDYDANIGLRQKFISDTEKSILFSGSNEEFEILLPEIESANNRGVSVVSILFDQHNKGNIP